MKTKELISIAVCTYNAGSHLSEQLDSLVQQDYPNMELIIVDDHSTDQTWPLLKAYEQQYPFIKIYQNERNLGYIKNFEKAISLCSGTYICLSDQDDRWKTNKLTYLHDQMTEEEVLIYHDSEYITEEGLPMQTTLSKQMGYTEGKAYHSVLLNNCIAGHAILFRRSLTKDILPMPLSIPHDHWIAYVALKTGGVKFNSACLVYYRQHLQSVTYTLHQKKENEVTDLFKEKLKTRTAENLARIKHLDTIKRFKGNTIEDIRFIEKLAQYLRKRDEGYFSIGLFLFMLRYRKKLFIRLHKSFLSNAVTIFKESQGNKLKMLKKSAG